MPAESRVAAELRWALVEQPRHRRLLPARRLRRPYGRRPAWGRDSWIGPIVRSATHGQTLARITDNRLKLTA
jgi:hypothetical protein